MDFLGADDRHWNDRRTRLEREAHEAAAAEAREAVAVAKELADALDAFGKHADELVAAQQPFTILGAGAESFFAGGGGGVSRAGVA